MIVVSTSEFSGEIQGVPIMKFGQSSVGASVGAKTGDNDGETVGGLLGLNVGELVDGE